MAIDLSKVHVFHESICNSLSSSRGILIAVATLAFPDEGETDEDIDEMPLCYAVHSFLESLAPIAKWLDPNADKETEQKEYQELDLSSTTFEECVRHFSSVCSNVPQVTESAFAAFNSETSYHEVAIKCAQSVLTQTLDTLNLQSMPLLRLVAFPRSLDSKLERAEVYKEVSSAIRTHESGGRELAKTIFQMLTTSLYTKWFLMSNSVEDMPIQVFRAHLRKEFMAVELKVSQQLPLPKTDLPTRIRDNKCSVEISGQERPVKVFGIEKDRLTRARYRVISAMIEAHPRRLRLDDLKSKSGSGDANKVLRAIAKIDSDWQRAVSFPLSPGDGYGLSPQGD